MRLSTTQIDLLRHLHEGSGRLDDVLLNAAGFARSTADSLVKRGLLRTSVNNSTLLDVVITYHITERGNVTARSGHLCPECGCYVYRAAEKQYSGLCSQDCYWSVFENRSVYDEDELKWSR